MLAPAKQDTSSTQFGFCHVGGGINCVVDGDTFWFNGERIRVADIDTPETHPPRCAAEAELGDRATQRLHELPNAGPFSLETPLFRDEDNYGRKLRVVLAMGVLGISACGGGAGAPLDWSTATLVLNGLAMMIDPISAAQLSMRQTMRTDEARLLSMHGHGAGACRSPCYPWRACGESTVCR